ncbi:MAG: carboxymuconolactone decarboxylase family protein [Thalassobaculum sp.]|uniref:carboxymuconolactone decarboxylase family protein n=1 Tax=Thalassobaculum sp. TaxID=2022740 RepID=UPI0032EF3C6C
MQPRLNPLTACPDAYQAVRALNTYVQNCGLEHSLLELVKIRASQINGCAFCIDMHVKVARKAGESEQRLHLVAAWRESPLFSDRERAALAWTEALTLVAETRAPDEDFEALKAQFSEAEMTNLGVAIGLINVWNRLMVGFRVPHPAA